MWLKQPYVNLLGMAISYLVNAVLLLFVSDIPVQSQLVFLFLFGLLSVVLYYMRRHDTSYLFAGMAAGSITTVFCVLILHLPFTVMQQLGTGVIMLVFYLLFSFITYRQKKSKNKRKYDIYQ